MECASWSAAAPDDGACVMMVGSTVSNFADAKRLESVGYLLHVIQHPRAEHRRLR